MGFFDFLNASELKNELEQTKAAYAEKVEEIEQQKIEYEKKSQNYMRFDEEKESLQNKIVTLEEKIQTMQNNLDFLSASHQSILSQKSELDKRVEHQDRWMQNKIKDFMYLESKNLALQAELAESNRKNLSLSSQLSYLQELPPPVPVEQKAIYEFQQYFLRMKFYHILYCHCLEKILERKKAYCRQQYNAAIAACKQKIKDYEADFHIEEYKQLRSYISESEFNRLSPADRRQLALNRYDKAPKTEYEVGLRYERYIGYLYELENYEVRYHGAINKYRDKGIDLYAIKKKDVLVIQCKRWNKNAVINERTIRDLSGSVSFAKTKFPKRQIFGILYTTTSVTKEARQMAKSLNITIYENFDIKEYPMIKCNISETGEKIYHLPFDQQYDKTFITLKKGDFYASTIQEAENFGFRRAHKWNPEKSKHSNK